MKKLNKRQKLTSVIAIIIVAIILAIIITTNIINNSIGSEGYLSANSNAYSNLIANYIKKGITIGGITGTLESLNTFDATATPEDIAYGKTAYVKGEKITGTYRTLKDLEIGDYVAYKPDQVSSYSLTASVSGHTSNQTIPQDNLNWRILSKNDDGTVNLISDTTTSTNIYLGGAIGYNNGVYILNDIVAKQYSNSSLGVTARSLTIEDIEAGMTESGLNYVHSYTSGDGVEWGKTKNYSTYKYYPYLYTRENGSGINTTTTKKDGINQSDSYYTVATTEKYTQASTILTVTQTLYERNVISTYYKNSDFYDLIYSNSGYWLSTRFANCYSDYADFGLCFVAYNGIYGSLMFRSNSYESNSFSALKPVVSLEANLEISSGDGNTPETAYQLANF